MHLYIEPIFKTLLFPTFLQRSLLEKLDQVIIFPPLLPAWESMCLDQTEHEHCLFHLIVRMDVLMIGLCLSLGCCNKGPQKLCDEVLSKLCRPVQIFFVFYVLKVVLGLMRGKKAQRHAFTQLFPNLGQVRLEQDCSRSEPRRRGFLLHFFIVQSLSCVRLCDPTDCSMPGSSVLHYLSEFAHIHVH